MKSIQIILIVVICCEIFLLLKIKPCHHTDVDFTKIAMPEYYRNITGYDSIQLIRFPGDTLNVNFCNPNKYEFEKFKRDTVYIHDTIHWVKSSLVNVIEQPVRKYKAQFRVEWQSMYTGYKSHGDWFNDYSMVKGWVDWANQQDTGIKHWIGIKELK